MSLHNRFKYYWDDLITTAFSALAGMQQAKLENITREDAKNRCFNSIKAPKFRTVPDVLTETCIIGIFDYLSYITATNSVNVLQPIETVEFLLNMVKVQNSVVCPSAKVTKNSPGPSDIFVLTVKPIIKPIPNLILKFFSATDFSLLTGALRV